MIGILLFLCGSDFATSIPKWRSGALSSQISDLENNDRSVKPFETLTISSGGQDFIFMFNAVGRLHCLNGSDGKMFWQINILNAEAATDITYTSLYAFKQNTGRVYAVLGGDSHGGNFIRVVEVNVVSGDMRNLRALNIMRSTLHTQDQATSTAALLKVIPLEHSVSFTAGFLACFTNEEQFFFPIETEMCGATDLTDLRLQEDTKQEMQPRIHAHFLHNRTITCYSVNFTLVTFASSSIPGISFPEAKIQFAWRRSIPKSTAFGLLPPRGHCKVNLDKLFSEEQDSPFSIRSGLRRIPVDPTTPNVAEVYRKYSFRGLEANWWIAQGTLRVAILDSANGSTLYSTAHQNVVGDVHMLAVENTLVYTFAHGETVQPVLAAVEVLMPIYTHSGAKLLSNSLVSPFDFFQKSPTKESSDFQFVCHQHTLPEPVIDATVSTPNRGVATKSIVLVFQSGSVAQVPIEWLFAHSQSDAKALGLFQQTLLVSRDEGITEVLLCYPSPYESTANVLLLGRDIVLRKVSLGVPFDRLREDVPYSVLFGITCAIAMLALWLRWKRRYKKM